MKMDITVSKKMTINTGNYSSIQPSVSITLKDVDAKDYNEKLYNLTVLVDSAFTNNLIEHSEYMQMIKDYGLSKTLDSINKEEMLQEVENAIENLM
jgi:hypothetical protein